jgi:hypothetical protein
LQSSGWIRDGAKAEIECHRVEALVWKREVLGVYLREAHRPAVLRRLLSGEPKHAQAGVDPDDLDRKRVVGQAEPGAEADVEHAAGHALPHPPPPPLEHALGDHRPTVIPGRIAVVEPPHPSQLRHSA